MAEQSQNPGAVTNSFTKGMVKDYNETFVGEGMWTHARNASNNSHEGHVGVLGNEPANLKCVQLPYTLIGAILLRDDQWVLFTTDDTNSEIGLFDESRCLYSKVVNATCLNFKRTHLITGVARERFGCEDVVYWDDGLNPSRILNLSDIPYKVTKTRDRENKDCIIETVTDQLDCEQLRLSPLVKTPCIELKKGKTTGTLPNGSYQVAVAYTINQIRIGDYFTPSEVQSLFDHNNLSGSLEVNLSNLDQNFDEFELVVIYFANAIQTVKKLGVYSTNQTTVNIDTVDPRLETIPFALIPLRSQVYDRSEAMYSVSNYLMRVGMYTKFDFNYQIQANKIKTKWVAVQYPADYYVKGGNNAGYMRDEQYAFFIRWIYNTGDKSAGYHIPGRIARGNDAVDFNKRSTATVTTLSQSSLADGGLVIAEGEMGYWESIERYIDNKPEVWGELCGKPIRHHKFPDQTVHPNVSHYTPGGENIIILGVKFENITHPLDNKGNPIESIVGYEILRGSREGQKTIVAKGLFNNMREFDIPDRPNVKGLFQNYPYNDLRADYYLTTNKKLIEKGSFNDVTSDPHVKYKKNIFSFHSPETTFSKPFLSVSEVKIYQEANGKSVGYFENPYKHPKAKVIGQGIELVTKVITVVDAIIKINAALGETPPKVTTTGSKDLPFAIEITPVKPEPKKTVVGGIVNALGGLVGINGLGDVIDDIAYGAKITAYWLQVGYVAYITAETTKAQLTQLVYGLVARKQYAAQYNSHGFYNDYVSRTDDDAVRQIVKSYYMDQNLQTFGTEYIINNLFRNTGVVIELDQELANPVTTDDSRNTLVEYKARTGNKVSLNQQLDSKISSLYGAIKTPLASQYGQVHSVLQMPTFSCMQYTTPDKKAKFISDVIFGGDTYVNRFTEKNPFYFFNEWLFDMDDEFEYDYRSAVNIPYPRYWLDSSRIEYSLLKSSANVHRLNDGDKEEGFFYQKPGYFYLFCNGVRDFFVESEINLAQRDWGENISQRHYDPYAFTDLSSMFRSDVIKSSNYYKYDFSLSVTKLQNNFQPWSFLLPRDYSPLQYEKCFTYQPNRVTYSLQQTEENKKDNWRVFLTNNYRDFSSRVTCIKPIGKTGAMFMLEDESPFQFVGVDTLQTDAGTKLYIGDGGLLNPSTPIQSISNADRSYQYGSCQSRYAVLGSPQGVFYVSQNQGKIFQYGGQLDEISRKGMKWWFAKYLPSELLKVYPDYPLYDNPVKGVGVQMIYDNTHEIIYITKKDYKPVIKNLLYDDGGFYKMVNAVKTYYPFDSAAFENASWTVSYDPKNQVFLSFHDWKPTFVLPGKSHFMSVDTDSIWKHNIRCDLYCNFYGKDYPFDVEFISSTGQSTATVRNVEYLMEAYRYHNDCSDKFHVLDEGFDQAMIYNSEQVSGLLELTLKSKINPLDLLSYPQVQPQSIKIHYSKEENKYRFNEFWDITKNRGEFTPVNVPMFQTAANGYEYQVNPVYVDYNKSPLERKRFRHNVNRVWLRRLKSGDLKILFKLSNQKINPSYR